jgi:hypothetical protein
MARHFSDRVTDQNFAESILDAIDEGYETILVVATTRPFTDALIGYVIDEREPYKVTREAVKYANGQQVRFLTDRTDRSRGIQVDRVLVHPLASTGARYAAIPCERPDPRKVASQSL